MTSGQIDAFLAFLWECEQRYLILGAKRSVARWIIGPLTVRKSHTFMNLEVFIMTAKELAAMLNGREYSGVISNGEAQDVKEAGLIVAYGYSDDNVEFDGAIRDEVGACDGNTIYLTSAGILQNPDCDWDDCPYFAQEREKAKTIKAVWHDRGGPCWTFETDIPHETFTINEDGEPFCEGIVFSMEHLRGEAHE